MVATGVGRAGAGRLSRGRPRRPESLLAVLLALAWVAAAQARNLPGARRPLGLLGAALVLTAAVPFGLLVDWVDFRVHARSVKRTGVESPRLDGRSLRTS